MFRWMELALGERTRLLAILLFGLLLNHLLIILTQRLAQTATLVDGPRLLGVESLAASGATLRLHARTAPNREDGAAC